MIYPYMKLVVPSALKAHKNGQLPANLLAKVKTGGQMYAPVAVQFDKMYDAALAAGFKVKNVGDYRSFEGQLAMFRDRYVLENTGTGVTRTFEGKTWYLKKGKACFDWMCANAPKYGFYLQGSDPKSKEFEAWHWQYCLGDATPDGSVAAPAEVLKPSGGSVEAGPMEFKYPGAPIKLGSKSTEAMLVQAVIGAKADGDFGSKSVEALKVWQRANGLKDDGVVGSVTWEKMF